MTSIFPSEERAPQPAFDRDQLPEEVRLDFSQLLDWFTPNIFVCWIVLGMNVLVFAAMINAGFNPDHPTNQILLKGGADYGPLTIGRGEWWRLLTCAFVHMGIAHVGFNMLVLAQIGPFMERLLGSIGFVIVYLTCAVAGSVCSLAWNPYLISAGASGAIFGLYGALIGFLILRRDSIPGPVLANLVKGSVVFLAVNAVFGALKSRTDLAAHAGGLVGGLVCGLVVSTPIVAGFRARRIVRSVIAGLGCSAVLFVIAANLPKPIDLQGKLSQLGEVERKTLAAYVALFQTKGAKDLDVAQKLETQVIGPWRVERKSLAAITGLPSRQQHLVGAMVTYMDGRQKAWETMVQALKTHNRELMKQSLGQQVEVQNRLKELTEGLK